MKKTLKTQVEQTFNVSIHQDTNLSDQSDRFKRFDICNNNNKQLIGRINFINGSFEAVVQRNSDGTYSKKELLNNIAEFMNKNNLMATTTVEVKKDMLKKKAI